MSPRVFLFVLPLLGSCLIAVRNDVCDPGGSSFDAEACRAECRAISCPTGQGSQVTADEGCACVPCDEIRCDASEYRSGCACLPLHGVLDCASDPCRMACADGYGDCDGSTSNGCEAALATDGDHCGRCGHGCEGGACESGQCMPVVLAASLDLLPGPSLTADEEVVALSSELPGGGDFDGKVVVYDHTGGTPRTLASGLDDNLSGVVLRGGEAFWCVKSLSSDAGFLMKSPTGSAQATTVTTIGSCKYGKLGFLPRSGEVIAWVFIRETRTQELRRYGDGPNTTLLSGPDGLGYHVTGDDQRILASDRGALWYWEGASPKRRLADVTEPETIALDDTHAYFADPRGVARVPLAGGDVTVLSSAGTSSDLALDDTHVYFISTTVRRVPKAGGEVVDLGLRAGVLAASRRSLFLVRLTSGEDELVRVAKP